MWVMLRNLYASHPAVDHVLPLVILGLAALFGTPLVPADASSRFAILSGAATLAGLFLAAAVLTCTLTYQGQGEMLLFARKQFQSVLRRNWVAILLWALACAVAPIVAMFIDQYSPSTSMLIATYALGLLSVRFCRVVWWLRFTLLMTDSPAPTRHVPAPPLKDPDRYK